MSFKQKDSGHPAVRKSGCCFCCCCYLGGLDTIDEVDGCFFWAIEEENKFAKASDAYVNIDKDTLADKIATKYHKTRRAGNIVANKARDHFWVEQNGNEIYNSVRPGYGHL